MCGTRRHAAFCRARVPMAAIRIPARLIPSCVAALTNSVPPPSASESAMSAAAGTGGDETGRRTLRIEQFRPEPAETAPDQDRERGDRDRDGEPNHERDRRA